MWIPEDDFHSGERDCSTPELEDWWKTSSEGTTAATSNLMLMSLTMYGILYLIWINIVHLMKWDMTADYWVFVTINGFIEGQYLLDIQGDHSSCSLRVVEIKAKVVYNSVSSMYWNTFALISSKPDGSPCMDVLGRGDDLDTQIWQKVRESRRENNTNREVYRTLLKGVDLVAWSHVLVTSSHWDEFKQPIINISAEFYCTL